MPRAPGSRSINLNADRRQSSATARIAAKASPPSTTEEKHAQDGEQAQGRRATRGGTATTTLGEQRPTLQAHDEPGTAVWLLLPWTAHVASELLTPPAP